jgi:bifunctional non-homologous end joining protein LigD
MKVTRPAKVLFPKDGFTKGELVAYYDRIAPRMMPYLAARPLVLERFPDGIARAGFIQKAAGAHYPSWIKTVTVKKVGGIVRHVVCDDAATLTYLANQACITFHTWLSRVDALDSPDQMIFDFDPSRDGDTAGVVGGALVLKEILDDLELPAYVKSTGSRGVHVVVPLDAGHGFAFVRGFARRLAAVIVDRDSTRYTLEQYKKNRRGRVFIDINRNAYAQTAAAPYSVRPRDGAPVSVPLHWSELRKKTFQPDAITVRNIFDHLDRVDDPWKRFWRDAVSLEDAARKLESLHAA